MVATYAPQPKFATPHPLPLHRAVNLVALVWRHSIAYALGAKQRARGASYRRLLKAAIEDLKATLAQQTNKMAKLKRQPQ